MGEKIQLEDIVCDHQEALVAMLKLGQGKLEESGVCPPIGILTKDKEVVFVPTNFDGHDSKDFFGKVMMAMALVRDVTEVGVLAESWMVTEEQSKNWIAWSEANPNYESLSEFPGAFEAITASLEAENFRATACWKIFRKTDKKKTPYVDPDGVEVQFFHGPGAQVAGRLANLYVPLEVRQARPELKKMAAKWLEEKGIALGVL